MPPKQMCAHRWVGGRAVVWPSGGRLPTASGPQDASRHGERGPSATADGDRGGVNGVGSQRPREASLFYRETPAGCAETLTECRMQGGCPCCGRGGALHGLKAARTRRDCAAVRDAWRKASVGTTTGRRWGRWARRAGTQGDPVLVAAGERRADGRVHGECRPWSIDGQWTRGQKEIARRTGAKQYYVSCKGTTPTHKHEHIAKSEVRRHYTHCPHLPCRHRTAPPTGWKLPRARGAGESLPRGPR